MFLLLFALTFAIAEISQSQVVYSRVVPYDPRYMVRRAPVRRSAMDTLERMRLPVARYFPQVDTQVDQAPYQPPPYPYTAYQLTPEDIYALPPQWTQELMDRVPQRDYDDEEAIADYDDDDVYAPAYRAVYADEVYPQQEPEANAYDDLMMNYNMPPEPAVDEVGQAEMFQMQRRGEGIPISDVIEANRNATKNATASITAATGTEAPVTDSPVPVPPVMPEKKELNSLVIPVPSADMMEQSWDAEMDKGQKEIPFFRPRQSSQQTRWSELEEQLSRVKNSSFKRPIPLIKKMIQGTHFKSESDALAEQLSNLRQHTMP